MISQTLLIKEVENMCNISSLYIRKGEIKGKIEGRIEGKIEGKFEAKKQMIINMFNLKIPVEVIAAAAEFTVSETEKIIKENKDI